jgi:hypothetical protein
MTEAFDSPTVLNVKYAFGLAGTLSCSLIIVRILFNIELNQFKRSVAPEVEKNLSELTLSSTNSEDDEYTNGNQSVINPSLSKDSIQKIKNSKSEDSFARKKRVHKETKFGIYFNVALLTFVNYLLMVYLPSGVVPSLIAMVFLTAILLRTQLMEDLRRKRFDRISAVFTLLIFMASFLSLCTYATIGHKEGGVYEGKARIVGYDVTNYNDGAKGGDMQSGAVRTDLEVEWGGQWGCPDTPEKQCHAYVSGALCEAKTNRRRRSRTLKKDKKIQDANDVKEYYKEVKDEVDEYTGDLKEEVDEVAEEDGLDYVADLEAAGAVEKYYVNATETEIDTEEKDIDNTVDSVEADLSNVKDTVLEGDDPDGSMASGVINETTTDLQALEDKIAELEKEVEVLEETNAEEEELTEIDQSNAEYYASEVTEVVDETIGLTVENEELAEDVTYYANLADEEIETNNALVNANEDLQEETQELENEVDNTKKYYKQKEANEPTVTEVITKTYYPVNATNVTGEYYVYTTTEEETVNNNAYGSNGDGDDDFMYAFEDDFFEDEYWGYDWDSAWGDYACNDLFDTDLSDQTYDENEAPGNDVFPYVNIYGACNSCKAFLVDYYSTAHFDKIREYQTHAVTYAVFGVVSILVTVALMIKEHVSPAQENQIDLLMSAGAYV